MNTGKQQLLKKKVSKRERDTSDKTHYEWCIRKQFFISETQTNIFHYTHKCLHSASFSPAAEEKCSFSRVGNLCWISVVEGHFCKNLHLVITSAYTALKAPLVVSCWEQRRRTEMYQNIPQEQTNTTDNSTKTHLVPEDKSELLYLVSIFNLISFLLIHCFGGFL